MDQKEKWIEETLQSLNNVQKAPISPLLSERLLRITKSDFPLKTTPLNPFLPWVAAASIALLIGFNILTARNYQGSQHTSNNTENTIYREYFNYLNTLN